MATNDNNTTFSYDGSSKPFTHTVTNGPIYGTPATHTTTTLGVAYTTPGVYYTPSTVPIEPAEMICASCEAVIYVACGMDGIDMALDMIDEDILLPSAGGMFRTEGYVQHSCDLWSEELVEVRDSLERLLHAHG